MEHNTNKPNEKGEEDFALPLPHPHSHIRLTRPRLDDAPDILPILNNDAVGIWMGVPRPHELHHARAWLGSVIPACDVGQKGWQEVRRVKGTKASTGNSSLENNNETEEGMITIVRECPVRIIREIVQANDARGFRVEGREMVYLGDLGLVRWKFQDISDKVAREQEIARNGEKKPGDPSIIWSIGYYLKPSHQGRGIMKTAIQTLLAWAEENMAVKHLRTTAMEDNWSSLSILKQNGFVVERILPEYAIKGDKKVGLAVLEKKI